MILLLIYVFIIFFKSFPVEQQTGMIEKSLMSTLTCNMTIEADDSDYCGKSDGDADSDLNNTEVWAEIMN